MKIVIVGFGTAGKHYLNLIKSKKKVELFITDKIKLPASKIYKQISFNNSLF